VPTPSVDGATQKFSTEADRRLTLDAADAPGLASTSEEELRAYTVD
jgi:hypothetical protein